jgi:hypothetical protein
MQVNNCKSDIDAISQKRLPHGQACFINAKVLNIHRPLTKRLPASTVQIYRVGEVDGGFDSKSAAYNDRQIRLVKMLGTRLVGIRTIQSMSAAAGLSQTVL